MPTLAKRCSRQFLAGDRRRGEDYFRRGKVLLDSSDGRGVTGEAYGSGRNTYALELRWERSASDGVLEVYCGCPRYEDGYNCKHLWAALLTLDGDAPQAVPGSSELTLVDTGDSWPESWEGEEAWDDDEDEPWADSPAAPWPTSGWRQRLLLLRTAAAHDQLVGSPTLQATSEKARRLWLAIDREGCRQRGELVLAFYQQEMRKSGGWGKIKRLRLSSDMERAEQVLLFSDAQERRLLLELYDLAVTAQEEGLEYAYFLRPSPQVDQVTLPALLYDSILPRIAGCGRLLLSTSSLSAGEWAVLEWDDGPPWHPVLVVEKAGDEVKVEACLERDAERRGIGEESFWLDRGLVVVDGALARLEGPGIRCLTLFGQSDPLFVPLAEAGELMAELWTLPELPPVDLPEEWRPEEVRLTPQPRLALAPATSGRKRTPALVGSLSFDYGGVPVELGQWRRAVADPQGRRLLLRDQEAEAAAVGRLVELGFSADWSEVGSTARFQVPSARLVAVVELLLEESWAVLVEGDVVRRPGSLTLRVASGIDWFDLSGEIDFEVERLTLPRLLDALETDQRMVRLGDGSYGMLPAAWLDLYGPLSDLAQEEDGEAVRFLPSQALLLDALLAAAPEVDVDARFAELRQRLRAFDGIEPRAEPEGFTGQLRPYQREGLGWLGFLQEFAFGGCLADDMGLGKTVQVLALLVERRAAIDGADRRPSLVVVPRSLLYNWLEEAARFAPALRVAAYHGPSRGELRPRLAEHDFVVTTYGTLRRDIAHLMEVELDYVVLDEAQAIKNPGSLVAKASRLLVSEHRLALTGTPVENHLGELWSIFEFLNPGMLGNLPRLKDLTSVRWPGDDALVEIARTLRPFILRRTKSQVLADLPEKTEQTLYCELDGKQRKLYDELRDHYRAALTQRIGEVGLGRAKIHVLEALLRLRQAACHPGLLDEARGDGGSAKLETLLEQVTEVVAEGHKVLVFSQFTRFLAIVRRHLDQRGVAYEYLDGRTRDRQQRVERFQNDPDCPLFLISLKAGGLGLNLTAADYVFLLDPWWNPAVEAQAIDRTHRIGQTRPVFAYRLISRDTVEEKILALQQDKRELADAILSADRSLIRSLTAEDLELLLS